MTKWFGQGLLWSGFLLAAYASVLRLAQQEHPWSTIPWTTYGLGIAIGIVGVVVLRMSSHRELTSGSRVDQELQTLRQSLQEILQYLAAALTAVRREELPDVLQILDHQCAEPFAKFADARNALVQYFGLSNFADVMSDFASGERYANRAWSAAADGYVDEAQSSLEKADRFLRRAAEKLQKLDRARPAAPNA